MKVLYFVSYPQIFTGSQRSLSLLVKDLPKDIERLVVFSSHGPVVDRYDEMGIPTDILEVPAELQSYDKRIMNSSALANAFLFLKAIVPYTVKAYRLIRREQPDIIHCNEFRAVLLVGWAAKFAKKPVIWHVRGEHVLGNTLYHRPIHMLTNYIITVADVLKGNLDPRVPQGTIYNGIDPDSCEASPKVEEQMKEMLKAKGFSLASNVNLVTVSSLVPFKGLHHLVDALNLLFQSRPDLKGTLTWTILGHPSSPLEEKYQAFLKQKIEDYGLQRNVFWAGWQNNAYAWIKASNIVVLPTVLKERFTFPDGEGLDVVCTEGFPRTILEAMAAGKPVIACNVAGVREMVDEGETGLMVPPSDPSSLADAIARLVDDPERLEQMGRTARKRIDRFTVKRCVEETVKVYHHLAGERARSIRAKQETIKV